MDTKEKNNITNPSSIVSGGQYPAACPNQCAAPQQPMLYNSCTAPQQPYLTPTDQSALNRKYAENVIAIGTFAHKESIKTHEATQRNIDRAYLKEAIAEKKRGIYEEIEVSPDGTILIQTKNSAIDTMPRSITNMAMPKLTRYIRMGNPCEAAYELHVTVGNSERLAYLADNNISSGTYLLRKLKACGVSIYKDKEAEQKKFAVDLIAFLISRGIGEEPIPDDAGWTFFPNTFGSSEDTYKFYKEEDLTWKQLMNLAK